MPAPSTSFKGGSLRADVTPEYLGVGYIIGIRVAAVMLAGGVFSWLVLMPAIYFFGSHLAAPLYPGTTLIRDMSPSDLWKTYVRPMGAGAVATAGLITLLRTAPTIFAALAEGVRTIRTKPSPAAAAYREEQALSARARAEERSLTGSPAAAEMLRRQNEAIPVPPAPDAPIRTSHDLPPSVVLGGSALLILLMFVFLQFHPVPGAQVGALANIAAALLVVLFGFLFVTVSARIVGIVGSSASPVSGMTIATLMATAAIFLVKGWTAPAFGALAITIGGMVCIAASNAGDTAQDLKTGYLIGATPWKQQVAIMFGVVVSVFVIGTTLNAMNKAFESFQLLPRPIPYALPALNAVSDGVQNKGPFTRDSIPLTAKPGTRLTTPEAAGASLATALPATTTDSQGHQQLTNTRQYILLNAIGSTTLEDGKYLYNPATHSIDVQWVQGIGSEKAAAPQGRLMATVINGILTRRLAWSLVLLGVCLVIGVELLGIRSLTFAVGAYLSIATTLAIFVGGLMRWMVDRAMLHHAAKQAAADHAASLALYRTDRTSWLARNPHFDETNPEHLDPATGLPVPTAVTPALDAESEISPGSLYASGLIAAGGIVGLLGVALKIYEDATHHTVPHFAETNPLHHDWVSVLMFALLAFSLFYFARKPLDTDSTS